MKTCTPIFLLASQASFWFRFSICSLIVTLGGRKIVRCGNPSGREENSKTMDAKPQDVTGEVTMDVVRHLERLAYLQLSEVDRASLVGDLSKVLGYARSLTRLDLTEFEPQTHAMDQANVMRADEVQASSTLEQALANAPQAASPYLQVPRVLE